MTAYVVAAQQNHVSLARHRGCHSHQRLWCVAPRPRCRVVRTAMFGGCGVARSRGGRRSAAWWCSIVVGTGRYDGVVRNLADGRVELRAEGERAELDAFRQAVEESELGHFIQQAEVSWDEAGKGFRGFEIVR